MPMIIESFALIVSTLATTTAGANLLYLGTLAAAYGGVSSSAMGLVDRDRSATA